MFALIVPVMVISNSQLNVAIGSCTNNVDFINFVNAHLNRVYNAWPPTLIATNSDKLLFSPYTHSYELTRNFIVSFELFFVNYSQVKKVVIVYFE